MAVIYDTHYLFMLVLPDKAVSSKVFQMKHTYISHVYTATNRARLGKNVGSVNVLSVLGPVLQALVQ